MLRRLNIMMSRNVLVHLAAVFILLLLLGASVVFWGDIFGLSKIERAIMVIIGILFIAVFYPFGVRIGRKPPR